MQVRQHFDGRDVALLPSILLVVGSKFVLSHLHLTVHLGLCPEPLPVPALPFAMPPISCGEEPSPALGNGDGSSFVAATCPAEGRDRWSTQSVKGLLTAPPVDDVMRDGWLW